MNFSITEEQEMLVDSVARFIDNDYDFENRQKIAASDTGFSRQHWQTFAELGWTAIPFSEADGGFDGGPVEIMLMMQQFGRGLVLEPYLANIVLAGGVLQRAASAAQKQQWLAPIIAGELHAALAFAEPQSRFDISNIGTTACADGDGFVLSGAKTLVLNGGNADLLIIPARTAGSQTDETGVTLFAVAADAVGIRRNAYKTVDGLQAAEIWLDRVSADASCIIGAPGEGLATLAPVIDMATLAVCAEAIGIMRIMHEKTVEYAKSRVQFGVPIGSFQALQHRMVDTLIACEQSLSLLLWTAMVSSSGNGNEALSISALKHQVGTAGQQVAKEAVQIHGGMGVTWELDVAHYFKRLTAICLSYGNADWHLDKLAESTP